jgi:hypothetical protein
MLANAKRRVSASERRGEDFLSKIKDPVVADAIRVQRSDLEVHTTLIKNLEKTIIGL